MAEHLEVLALEAYAEGALPLEQRRQVEAHLAACPACRVQAERHERLAALAARLPAEPAPVRLAAQIRQAIAARAVWRRVGSATLVCGGLGLAFMLLALPDIIASVSAVLAAFEANDLAPLINALLAAPAETLMRWAGAGLDWPAGLTEGAGVVFLLGLALLTVAAFGGLAQMLHAGKPANAPRHNSR